MTFKANEIEQYPYLVYTDDAGNVYDPNGGGGGGGGATIVNATENVEGTLDKTWNEITNADAAFIKWTVSVPFEINYSAPIHTCFEYQGMYGISVYTVSEGELVVRDYVAESADGYPVFQEG